MKSFITKQLNIKTFYLLILFSLAFLERTFFDLGANIELVTAVMVLSSIFLGRKYSFWLTFFIMLTTDFIIGNSNIFIFTWSGFLIPALILGGLSRKIKKGSLYKITSGTLLGMGSTLFFYFWTNFGVWLIGSMYPKTFTGLMQSYIMGLPFLRLQQVSTLIFVPLGLLVTETCILVSKKISLSNKFS